MQLSPHFSLVEMTHTDTGLSNEPNVEQGADLVRLCDTILEPMRIITGALHINSGFRSLAVNNVIGGVHNSQHMLGQAADVRPLEVSQGFAFLAVKDSAIPYDQIISEPGWIHISVAALGAKPRHQALRARMENGRMIYESA